MRDEVQISTESHPDLEKDKGEQSPTEDRHERDEAELGRVEVVQFEPREQGGARGGHALSRSDGLGRAVEKEALGSSTAVRLRTFQKERKKERVKMDTHRCRVR